MYIIIFVLNIIVVDVEEKGCTHGFFRCENGPCIPGELKCDGKLDCPLDNSDELDCPEYSHGIYHRKPIAFVKQK